MSRFSLACLLRGAVAMVLLIAPPAATAKAQGGSAPPPSLERLLQAARTGDVAGVANALSAGALDIWHRIQQADPESRTGLPLRLAIATALRPPGTGAPGAGHARPPGPMLTGTPD